MFTAATAAIAENSIRLCSITDGFVINMANTLSKEPCLPANSKVRGAIARRMEKMVSVPTDIPKTQATAVSYVLTVQCAEGCTFCAETKRLRWHNTRDDGGTVQFTGAKACFAPGLPSLPQSSALNQTGEGAHY